MLEHWSTAENVTGALERCGKIDWSATVLERRKIGLSTSKLKNRLEYWSPDLNIPGALDLKPKNRC